MMRSAPMTPSSPFTSEAERLRAREALIATVNAIPTKQGTMFGHPHGLYMLWEGCAEMEGEDRDVVMSALLTRFDHLYPPIVDVPKGMSKCYCDMDAATPDRECPVHGAPPSPDFDAALDGLMGFILPQYCECEDCRKTIVAARAILDKEKP